MMKKRIIKISCTVFLIVLLLVPCFTNPPEAKAVTNANTLAELRKELADYKAKKNAADANKKKTQAEIRESENTIARSQQEITNNQQKIEESKRQIALLDEEIKDAEEEIKELLRTYEITSGDNNYLEYIFGASSISDFIIRYSISGQLASYNDETIAKHENKIEENKQLQIELAEREKKLNSQIANLQNNIEKLGNQRDSFSEDALKFEDEIKTTQELINEYVKMGCGENEPFSACLKMQSDTGFLRPLKKGIKTSNFGYRTHPVTGVPNKFHSGIDIGGNGEGTAVYSVANGMVGKIIKRSSCGGNQVYIYHTIRGVKYTSVYMHLLTMNVKVGDYVTNQSVIGTVGGGRGTSSYDSCSTGPHLHFSLAKGWYGSTYVSYSTYVANLMDPGVKDKLNIPSGKYFYSRSW